ncbi:MULTISPECIES: phosphate ABC transporter permease PstA [unclassified Pseudonocardia]|jgi:phosphate transport system permease protein|uniref:phosphate ABC transporter permease PstA n=1 Tax=unclassified Pseudonocardia TaxID=2619320 RepID=UPI0009646B25|nr:MULTISPECIES: phosphate ABC transporter permease PstA [unclassified Pseudonocardia]MBN9102935.1 phosphate ABC transporter permease PstA [Pseudonocardia sp.]OJY51577.1 MAG: phosphate ABC transporter, permease protein PstA [Pseudonocardia sp. 73-21]
MSIDTERAQQEKVEPPPGPVSLVRAELPRWAPYGILVASLVVVGVLLAVTGGFSIGLFVFLSAVLFGLATYLVSRVVEGARKATDRLVTIVVTVAFLIALIPLISVVITVVTNGLARFDAAFFTQSMRGVGGANDLAGGGYHAIMGTLIITALAAVMSIPVGVLTAVYLVEYGSKSRLARAVTFFVDVMTGIPSIVAGLFSFALFALFFGPSIRLGFAGSVALSVLMIPVVVRSTEEMLKIVPNELREAAYALGTPKWRTILKVVIPTSIAGIASGITLAIARVIGETAPLLIAVGITTGLNLNPFANRMATLPVFAYYSYAAPGVPREPFIDRAWTSALVLIIIVLVLNLVARLVARVFAPKTR